MAKQTLSKASPFETTFKTRYRGPGRPVRDDDLFPPTPDVDYLIKKQAQRRAFAVVQEENRERIAEVYLQELAVLNRRGVEQVAADCGVDLKKSEG